MGRPDYYGNPAGLQREAEIVRALYAAFSAHDLDAALIHFDPACELHIGPTAEAVGRTEPYRGHAGVREYFDDVARAWDRVDLHPDDFRLMPGIVIVLGRVFAHCNGTTTGRFVVWTWTLRADKVILVRVSDTGPIADA